jgi:hypothetical protein
MQQDNYNTEGFIKNRYAILNLLEESLKEGEYYICHKIKDGQTNSFILSEERLYPYKDYTSTNKMKLILEALQSEQKVEEEWLTSKTIK